MEDFKRCSLLELRKLLSIRNAKMWGRKADVCARKEYNTYVSLKPPI